MTGLDWRAVLVTIWERGQRLSAVGPGDVRVHLDHAARLAAELSPPSDALDLGSGAGIPGLALAGLWPQSRWTLVDAAQRRVRLLEAAIEELGWGPRVQAVHGRAEELGWSPQWRRQFDLVTARLFGPPAAAAECGAPFLRIGGILAVTEPPASPHERWPVDGLAPLGLVPLTPVPGLQRLRLETEPERRFPRKPGVPVRRPLF